MDYTIEDLKAKGFKEVDLLFYFNEGKKIALSTTSGTVFKGRLFKERNSLFLITNNPKAAGGITPREKDFGRRYSWRIGHIDARDMFIKDEHVSKIFVDNDSTALPLIRTVKNPIKFISIPTMPPIGGSLDDLELLRNGSTAGKVICMEPDEPEKITATEVRDLVDSHEATQTGIDQMTLELRAMIEGREKALETINGAIRDQEKAIAEAEKDKAAIIEKLDENGLKL